MRALATESSARTELTEIALRRALATLSPEDLAAVAAGRARLEVRPVAPSARRRPPATPVPARDHELDVATAVERINALPTPTAVEDYLKDPRFTAAVLKQIARALGPTVLATGRSKAEVRRDIVAGTVGFRSRSAAMSGGAWT
jgi:hypothetical protein